MDGNRRSACPEGHGGGNGGDRLAIGLSAVCLVHCLALPVVAVLAPALGVAFVHSEETVHWVLLALALPVSGYALWRGYARHGQAGCLVLGGLGLLLMFLGVSHLLSIALEVPLTIAGVVLLGFAHVQNLRRSLAVHSSA